MYLTKIHHSLSALSRGRHKIVHLNLRPAVVQWEAGRRVEGQVKVEERDEAQQRANEHVLRGRHNATTGISPSMHSLQIPPTRTSNVRVALLFDRQKSHCSDVMPASTSHSANGMQVSGASAGLQV